MLYVIVTIDGIGHGDTGSILGHSANIIGKSMSPIILPSAMGKLYYKLAF